MGFSQNLICRRLLLSRSSIFSRSVANVLRMSTMSGKSVIPPSKIQNSSPPCLMLSPDFDDDNGSVGFNSYNLAKNRVQTLPQTCKAAAELKDLMPNPIHDLRFCGSSHGWIALFNPHTRDLFIYNPISLRYIKLPPIFILPNYPKDNKRSAIKLILSCSPDEDEQNCTAVIIYNCGHKVAFCCLGQSGWTLFGTTYMDKSMELRKFYLDFVYSSRQNLFFGLTYALDLETWDLSNPSSPVLIKEVKIHEYYLPPQLPSDPNMLSSPIDYLVVADELFEDEKDDVLLVTRYVIEQVASDGTYVDYFKLSPLYPHITIDFFIGVCDQQRGYLRRLDSLGDFALFIGSCSDSLAMSVTQYPELKSNSIYFTDQYMERTESRFNNRIFGGSDIGIFDFENKIVSPCYYPCDLPNLKRIAPSPMWFFPRLV